MARYFNFFPTTVYTANTGTDGLDIVTNIISRFGFERQLKENSAAFYKYQIQDSDTPEIIAYKYYDNAERHWIVLAFNDIFDPQWDWPLKQENLIKYINDKYSSNGAANTTVQTGLQWAKSDNNVQSYYKTITRTNPDNIQISEVIELDAGTWANTGEYTVNYTLQEGVTITETLTKSKKTYYEYELEENEKKREINLLKPEFVPAVEKEFKRVIKGKR
jgi:hypothetical protein